MKQNDISLPLMTPDKTALIVIDMQADFYAENGSAVRRGQPVTRMRALAPVLQVFADRVSGAGVYTVFTQFVSGPGITPKNLQRAEDKEGAVIPCAVGSGGEAFSGISPPPPAAVIRKPHYDAFAYTSLRHLLDEHHISTVLVTGVRTDMCVEATAKRAAAEGYDTVIVTDMVATYDDRYQFHQQVLDTFRKYYGYTTDSREILRGLGVGR